MCVANLGPDVEVAGDATIVPSAAALAVARRGANSVTPLMCGIGSVSNVAADECVGCNTDDDCSDAETCTDSRCLGLPVTAMMTQCVLLAEVWDANTVRVKIPMGDQQGFVSCEAEVRTILVRFTKVVQSALSEMGLRPIPWCLVSQMMTMITADAALRYFMIVDKTMLLPLPSWLRPMVR